MNGSKLKTLDVFRLVLHSVDFESDFVWAAVGTFTLCDQLNLGLEGSVHRLFQNTLPSNLFPTMIRQYRHFTLTHACLLCSVVPPPTHGGLDCSQIGELKAEAKIRSIRLSRLFGKSFDYNARVL